MGNVIQQFQEIFRFYPKVHEWAVESHPQIMQDTAAVTITGNDAEIFVRKSFPLRFQIRGSENVFYSIDDCHNSFMFRKPDSQA
jgi:hypothetical protein